MVLYPETPLDDVPQLFLENRRSMNEDNDDGFQSVYVDSQGNEYEPYSMAWRYLGMYMDCEVDDDGNYYANDENDRRDLGSGSGDDTCGRKLLWAAYVDPRYQGGSIGEYQYYDPYTNTWDKSSCQTNRCAKMDCHDPHTHFELIGVFKETYGLYDWGGMYFVWFTIVFVLILRFSFKRTTLQASWVLPMGRRHLRYHARLARVLASRWLPKA